MPAPRPDGSSPRTHRLLLAGGAVAAALAAVAVRAAWARRSGTGASSGAGAPIVATGIVARNARLARLGARTGGSYARHRARRVFASAERREELDREHEIRTAEQVAAELGSMKGALMKLGQMVSYLDEGLPEHLRAALAQLQHDAPPMSAELAAQVVTEELGALPERLFAEWDPIPIAAASIGQVHRAMTHAGEAVAVKVQYPGVAEAIEADLGNVGLVFGGLGQVFDGLESGPLVEELKTRLREELDYRREARNQTRFADYYRDHPFIHVPRVHPELSTGKVLTTELAEGARFAEVETWSEEERSLAGETIFRFVFASFYRLHLFNGDPHPGNYLFRPGGQVTFLDFGLVKEFDPSEIDLAREMIDAMVLDPDPAAFRAAVEGAGFLHAGAPVSDELVAEYFGHFYEHVLHPGPMTFGAEFASETVRRFFDATGPYREVMRHTNVPPNFVVVQRINLGLFAILARLRATVDWRRVAEELWPWVGGAPSTPMGEQEAAWRAATGR
jgi:predicted unusual protein kinase regulating ubiquinone biosynthesis (AarF/ABC1/UbiB family)